MGLRTHFFLKKQQKNTEAQGSPLLSEQDENYPYSLDPCLPRIAVQASAEHIQNCLIEQGILFTPLFNLVKSGLKCFPICMF